jgi:hypothetical protein
VTLDFFSQNQNGEEIEQVAWHPYSDLMLGLNTDELELLNCLRSQILLNDGLSAEKKINCIEKLIKEK